MEKETLELSIKNEEKINKRIIYFDILNILSIVAVVALHCNGIVHFYDENLKKAWSTSLIIECIRYWAVPIFLMLSGATLMEYRKKYSTKVFFKKRILKVLIPFIFWAMVMTIWKYNIGTLKIESFSVKNLLNIFFSNQEESTYYFMFLILGIYITMPVLSILSEEKYRKIAWYTVIAIFITQSTIPIILQIIGITYNSQSEIQIGGFAIFPLLGYLLSTQELTIKRKRIIYISGILSLIFRYCSTFYWTTTSHTLNNILFGYVQFHSVILATAVFVLIKNINFDKIIKSEKVSRKIANIAGCSFGIYLIHQIVMWYEKIFFNINILSWQWRTIGIVCTYLISLAIVYILKKIPIIKRIVP